MNPQAYCGLSSQCSKPQVQPDTGVQVFCSGDGTVNYQSLRHGATWKDSCDVSIFELPGCDHRKDIASSCAHCSHADSYSLLAEYIHTTIIYKLSFQVESRQTLGCWNY